MVWLRPLNFLLYIHVVENRGTLVTWKEKGNTHGMFFAGPDSVRHRVEGEEEGGRGGEQDFCSEQTAFPSELQVQLVQVLEDHLLPGVQVEGQVRGQ